MSISHVLALQAGFHKRQRSQERGSAHRYLFAVQPLSSNAHQASTKLQRLGWLDIPPTYTALETFAGLMIAGCSDITDLRLYGKAFLRDKLATMAVLQETQKLFKQMKVRV
jgi:hypothetical protein